MLTILGPLGQYVPIPITGESTRNIKVTAYDADYETYWYNHTATLDCDWVEYSEGGSGAWNNIKSAMPRMQGRSGDMFQYCSWYNCGNATESFTNNGSMGNIKHCVI